MSMKQPLMTRTCIWCTLIVLTSSTSNVDQPSSGGLLGGVDAFQTLGKVFGVAKRRLNRMPPLEDDRDGDKVVHTASPALTVTGGATKDPPKIDKDIKNIFSQNKEWIEAKEEEDADFFKKLGGGHHPNYLWIGCSDARVPANEIMGEDAGSVFVVRNVANLVVSTDVNLMSALQYAVSVLKVPHIIVCGHYDCGGVRASLQNEDHVPPLENWLRNIRDVYRLHRKELDAIKDPEQRYRRLIELNVVEQCINLFKTGAVQRRRVETFSNPDASDYPYTTPQIHACVFDPATGKLRRLEVKFRQYLEELHNIYDLYTVDSNEGEGAARQKLFERKRSVPVHAPSEVDTLTNSTDAKINVTVV